MPSDDSSEANSNVKLVPGIKPPQRFNLGTNILENWKIFKQRWQTYAILSQLESQPAKVQVALYLHTLADDALRVYNGFQFDSDDSERTVNDIIEKFEDFAVGEVNETYERYLFNRRCQEEGEVFDTFLLDLRSLIKTCSYCNQCKNSLL